MSAGGTRPRARAAGRWLAASLLLLCGLRSSATGQTPPRRQAIEDAAALVEARLAAAAREPRRRGTHLTVAAARSASLGPAPTEDDAGTLRRAWARLAKGVARAKLRRGQPEAAIALLHAAADVAPDASTQLALGEALIAAYQPRAAAYVLRRGLSEAAGRSLSPPTRARALRALARAQLSIGEYEAARAAAAASRTIEWTDPAGRALDRFATRRAGLDLSALPSVHTARHDVRTDLGPAIQAAVVERLRALEPELSRLLPLPDGVRSSRRTRVYALSPARYTAIAPGGDAGASAFYHRDERAVYLAYASASRAARQLGHEALHAHLHRLVDEPPVWVEEGLADYVAMLPATRRGAVPRRHPIRLRDAQVAARGGRRPALVDLATLDRRALYREEGLARLFPFCWAWVYSLRHGEEGALRGVLDRYLSETLAGASGAEALDRATDGVDPTRLEDALRALLAQDAD